MDWFKKLDWTIIFFTVSLSVLGTLVLYGGGGETNAYKKIIWLVLGFVFMIIFANLNYQNLGSYTTMMYIVGIVLLVLTLLFAPVINGARAWIRIGPLGFQTSEFMKIALIFVLSRYLILKEKDIGKIREMIFPFLFTAFPLILIAAQPDLGYAVLFIPILLVMLFIGGANIGMLLGLVIVGFSVLFIPMYMEYQKFILVDSLVANLKEQHLQLAESVRVLNFNVWYFLDNPHEAARYTSSSLRWAIEAVTNSDNIKVINKAVEQVTQSQPVWLRDFFLNDSVVLIFILTSAVVSIGFYIAFFIQHRSWMRISSIAFLILSVSIAGAFLTRATISFKSHQVVRLISFANPDKFPKRSGYQLRHSLITIGSGQIYGKGLFHSDMTKGDIPLLPEWHNDFIFSVIGEQFGLLGTLLTLFLLFGLILRSAMIALQSKDDFGTILASGITALFFFHTFFNVGITMGLLPVTGIPLIFVSYGGSNMLSSFVAAGVLINIHKRKYVHGS